MNILPWLAQFFSAIGAINWGLTKFFDLNLVEYFCNMIKIQYLRELIYALVAVSGFFVLLKLFIG